MPQITARRSTPTLGALCFAAALAIPAALFAQATSPAVFVGNNAGHNLASFTVNPDGTLNFVANIPTGERPSALSLSPDGRILAVGHATANEVFEELRLFSVNPDATLTPLLTTNVPATPLDLQWIDSSRIAVMETRVTGTNAVHVYGYDAATNTLSPLDNAFTGSFSSSVAVTHGGTLLYANDSTNNVISGFAVAPDGTLTSVGVQSTAPAFPLDLTPTNAGNFLYAGGGISAGNQNILAYAIGSDGSLSPVPGTHFQSPANNPAWLAVSENDEYLFVAHTGDQTIRTFVIGPDGELTYTGHSFTVGATLSIGEMSIIGDLMITVDKSSVIDGRTGVLSLRINPDGSLTELGLWDTGGGRPEFLATWIPEPGTAAALAGAGMLILRRRRSR